MKRLAAVALAWMAGSVIAQGAQDPQVAAAAPVTQTGGDTKPGGDTSPIPQDLKVVITVSNNQLVAKPEFAVIRKLQPLRFAVEGLPAGMHVEIDFEIYDSDRGPSVKGPFPRRDHPANPVRGRYVLDRNTPGIGTANSDVAGYFKYHIVLREGTRDVFALDPGVVVKNDF
jgi:hypothetical protein